MHSQVIDIWPDLTRRYAGPSNCTGCVDSFIPINRTFIVAGGRFREPYYWDSFWIIEGLLRTKGPFTQIAENIIENFLDLVEQIGFVPNGARRYYLNRSQPPLLTQMVSWSAIFFCDPLTRANVNRYAFTQNIHKTTPSWNEHFRYWRRSTSSGSTTGQ